MKMNLITKENLSAMVKLLCYLEVIEITPCNAGEDYTINLSLELRIDGNFVHRIAFYASKPKAIIIFSNLSNLNLQLLQM